MNDTFTKPIIYEMLKNLVKKAITPHILAIK